MNKDQAKGAEEKATGKAQEKWGAAIGGKERRVKGVVQEAASGTFFYADENIAEQGRRARRKNKSYSASRLAGATVLGIGLVALIELVQLLRSLLA
jgi:hypothetical protein